MALIESTSLVVNLTPKPIEPSWIIEGHPVAQWCVLSKSTDGLASTMVWECSEGKFNWYYDFDETIMILEGSIVLENDTMRPTRYSAGGRDFLPKRRACQVACRGPCSQARFLPDDPTLGAGLCDAGVQQDQADAVALGQAGVG